MLPHLLVALQPLAAASARPPLLRAVPAAALAGSDCCPWLLVAKSAAEVVSVAAFVHVGLVLRSRDTDSLQGLLPRHLLLGARAPQGLRLQALIFPLHSGSAGCALAVEGTTWAEEPLQLVHWEVSQSYPSSDLTGGA